MTRRYTYEFVCEKFSERGYTLLSESYRKNTDKLYYRCDKHPDKIGKTDWATFYNKGQGCRECSTEKQRYSIEDVRASLLEVDCELISTEYKRKDDPVEYRCLIHYDKLQKTRFANVKKRGCTFCNRERMAENMTGEKHHRWNGGYHSEAERERRTPKYHEWRKAVYAKDNYLCQCCGKKSDGDLEAHHIENFANNPEIRYEIDNGLTMCKACHNTSIKGSFHNTYGTRNNNREQLEEYLGTKSTYIKGVFILDKNLKGVLDKWLQT